MDYYDFDMPFTDMDMDFKGDYPEINSLIFDWFSKNLIRNQDIRDIANCLIRAFETSKTKSEFNHFVSYVKSIYFVRNEDDAPIEPAKKKFKLGDKVKDRKGLFSIINDMFFDQSSNSWYVKTKAVSVESNGTYKKYKRAINIHTYNQESLTLCNEREAKEAFRKHPITSIFL